MARLILVPGLAVRRYLQPSADVLRSAGHDVVLCPPLGWRSVGSDLRRYGRSLAQTYDGPFDLVIGTSVGTQGAVAAITAGLQASQLLLISPTIDPGRRSTVASLRSWLGGESHPDSPRISVQSHDWMRAGPAGIYRGLRSAIDFHLEEELPRLGLPVTVVHGDSDHRISPLTFAAELADGPDRRLLVMPDAPHSWPVQDGRRFSALVDELIGDQPSAR